MKLIWLERALEDQDLILDYITERNEAAADDLYLAIEACCQRIVKLPLMYRSGREPGTREAVVSPNYILIYRVTDEVIAIVRLSTPGSNIHDAGAPVIH